MENRMKLNKRIKYELPDDVMIARYDSYNYKNYGIIPDFEPDLCINAWGDILGQPLKKMTKSKELWIKTDNQDLINYLKGLDYYKCSPVTSTPYIPVYLFKKIVVEFYGGENYGENTTR